MEVPSTLRYFTGNGKKPWMQSSKLKNDFSYFQYEKHTETITRIYKNIIRYFTFNWYIAMKSYRRVFEILEILITKIDTCSKILIKANSLNLLQTNESGFLFSPSINGRCKCKKKLAWATLLSRHLTVQSQQLKLMNNVWNLFTVNNKGVKTITIIENSLTSLSLYY